MTAKEYLNHTAPRFAGVDYENQKMEITSFIE